MTVDLGLPQGWDIPPSPGGLTLLTGLREASSLRWCSVFAGPPVEADRLTHQELTWER